MSNNYASLWKPMSAPFKRHVRLFWRVHNKKAFTFWDMHTEIYEKFVYKHSETIEYVKN